MMMPKPTRLTKTVRKMTSSGRDTSADYVTVLIRLRAPHGLRTVPILFDNRPQCLIEIFSTAKERFSQDALLDRAHLSKGAIAAAVLNGRSRFQAMDANDFECKLDHKLSSLREQSAAPECGSDCKSPLRSSERRFELADLEQSDRRLIPVGHYGEAQIPPGLAFMPRPCDESLEALDRRRRRRDEPRHFFGRQQREQRRRIARPQFAQRDALALQHRQPILPIRNRRRSRR